MNKYYIKKDEQITPTALTVEAIHRGIMEGTYTMSDYFKPEVGGDWKPLSEMSFNLSTLPQTFMQEKPYNRLFESICIACLCCTPIGIYTIYKSAQVNTLWAQGDYDGARAAAAAAKNWNYGSILAVVIFYIIAMLIKIGTEAAAM